MVLQLIPLYGNLTKDSILRLISTHMVRNDRRTRLLPKIILGQALFTLITVLVSGSIIFYSQGYRYNFKTLKVIKTGVLYLNFLPKDATITINDETLKPNSEIAKNLVPGTYFVSVKKESYISWNLTLKVEPSTVNDYKDIVLFKDDIKPTELTDNSKIDLLNTPIYTLATNAPGKLNFTDHEIWSGDQLVTRLSDPIIAAVWYPDLAHIIYQQGSEIRVIELNGKNDTLLFKLDKNTPVKMAVGARGTELYFVQDEIYKVATIR